MNLLEKHLFKYYDDGKSGVAFLSTNNNKACRITLNDGVLVAANMGPIKGFSALSELMKNGIKAGSFKIDMELPYGDDEKIESSDAALSLLGYSWPIINKEPVVDVSIPPESPTKNKKVRMYRGQIVED